MSDDALKKFGEWCAKLRRAKGITLREFCKTYDYDPAYISQLERGRARPMDQVSCMLYAVRLGLRVSDATAFMRAAREAKKCTPLPLTDDEVMRKLPVCWGVTPTRDRLEKLIDLIRKC